jgi:hypothetical protein
MASSATNDPDDQDWRLKAELDRVEGPADRRRSLDGLLNHLRSPAIVREIEAGVPRNVVVTHDGKLLLAYAADEATIRAARSAIEGALHHDQLTARIYVSHWDHGLDDWRQIDPPLSGEQEQEQLAALKDAEAIETRTLVVKVGREIRTEFEQSLASWAQKLGVECKIVEHPHLLREQVGFTVTGPKRKIDEFAQGLTAEEWATIRTERAVIASPL